MPSSRRASKKSQEREKAEVEFKLVGVPVFIGESKIKITMVPDDRYWEKKTIDGKFGYSNVLTKEFLTGEQILKKWNKLVGEQLKITFVARKKTLGTCTTSGIKKLVGEQKYWEALFSLHTVIHYQLQFLLLQSFRGNQGKNLVDDSLQKTRWKLVQQNLRYFRETVDICFAAYVIDDVFRDKLIKFNQTRDKIAHKLIHESVIPADLEKACSVGLELLGELENIWSKTIITQGASARGSSV